MTRPPLTAWVLALLATILLALPLGVLEKAPVYQAGLAPVADAPGSVIVVFYGTGYDRYSASGQLVVPKTGWQLTRLADTVRLEPERAAEPLRFTSGGEALRVSLIRHPGGGAARLDAGPGVSRRYALRTPQESIETLEIGGPQSAVPATGEKYRIHPAYTIAGALLAFVALLFVFAQFLRMLPPLRGSRVAGLAEGAAAKTLVVRRVPLAAWLIALVATPLLVLPFGVLDQTPVYRAALAPAAAAPGSVIVVFYGNRFDQYTAGGQLFVPKSGWKVTRLADAVRLEPERAAQPLRFDTEAEPLDVSLIRHPGGGVARLEGAPGVTRDLNLRTPQESVQTLQIGGPESAVPPTGKLRIPALYSIAGALLTFLALLALATRLAPRLRWRAVTEGIRSAGRTLLLLRHLQPAVTALALLATLLIVLPFGVFDKTLVYRATLAPVANAPGSVTAVFYGTRYDEYAAAGRLVVPKAGWKLVRLADTVRLEAGRGAAPLQFVTETDALHVALIRYPGAGSVRLEWPPAESREFDLRAPQESALDMQIGGLRSGVPPAEENFRIHPAVSIGGGVLAFVTLLTLFSLIARVVPMLRGSVAPGWRQLLVSLLLVCAAFPDAVLFGSTFRTNDLQWAVINHAERTDVYPVATRSHPREQYQDWYTSGLNDTGGSQFQSEPNMEFMRHTLATRDSPYWNPYSMAGSLGPESLVDLKFSVFTLAYAVLGGTTLVYDMLTLLGFWMAVFFVLRLCEGPLRLHPLAGIAAAVLFLLNGFSTANFGSNVAQSYVFVPVCLLASFRLMERRTPVRVAAAAAAYMALLSYTFLPTTLLAGLAVVVCTTGFAYCADWGTARKRDILLRSFGLQVLAGAIALCGVSLIYLPFLENLGVTGTLSSYERRVFYPASFNGLLSLFSSTHFFESYRAGNPEAFHVQGNTIFHYGVMGLGLVACAWRRGDSRLRPVAMASAVLALIVLARNFGIPGVTWIVDHLPVVRNIGEQYTWMAISVPLTILAGIGTQNLLERKYALAPQFVLVAIAAIGGGLAVSAYGMKPSAPSCHPWTTSCPVWSIALLQVLFVVLLLALWLIRRFPRFRWELASLLVALMFGQLVLDAKMVRFRAEDIYADPTSDVRFLKENAGVARTMTLGVYATAMDAGSAYQFQEVTSLSPAPMPGYRKYFMDMTRDLPPESRSADFLSLGMPQAKPSLGYYDWFLVNLLGVKYVIAPTWLTSLFEEARARGYPIAHVSRFTTIIENPEAFPRAFILPGAVPTQAEVTVARHLQAKDVVPVNIVSYRNASVVLQGEAAAPGLVVLTDNWHSRWSATVNGKPVDIAKVQGTFRGVPVPAGKFEIAMRYAPATLPLALSLSLLAWLFVLGAPLLMLVRRWRGKSPAGGQLAASTTS